MCWRIVPVKDFETGDAQIIGVVVEMRRSFMWPRRQIPKIPFDKTLKSAYNEGGEGNFSAGKDGQNIFHS